MRKAAVYIDGQNFHHGLARFGLDSRSFNFWTYARHLTQSKDLSFVKYYGARFPRRVSLQKHNSDDAFFKSLTKIGVIVVEGRFIVSGEGSRQQPREKGVDVRLATDLIFDAMFQRYDDAYVLSADTDLIPAIQQLKKHFRDRRIFNFSFNKLNIFEQACDECKLIYSDVAKRFIDANAFQPTSNTLADLKKKLSFSIDPVRE
ncbi:MAG: hypothetical protein A2428_03205 [Bdellovibrionales bacterium RIFOXYC1_FULL_54_43]|nr:MAG: hypothetical protein A2428_03205 [Bdellovibrionales bacterium RIFOXYC1_FULL_54_43]OFZ82689.1 MAG: hypothetical protein A2603_02640 [Bdellovibrionales bacterium RIFOXYD1_FULL_55_31]